MKRIKVSDESPYFFEIGLSELQYIWGMLYVQIPHRTKSGQYIPLGYWVESSYRAGFTPIQLQAPEKALFYKQVRDFIIKETLYSLNHDDNKGFYIYNVGKNEFTYVER